MTNRFSRWAYCLAYYYSMMSVEEALILFMNFDSVTAKEITHLHSK